MMLKSKHPSPQEQTPHLPPGLINHGNTCFMNSVLQGLIATRLLHDLVIFSPITPDLQRRLPTSLVSSRSPQLTNGHGIAGQHEQPWSDSMPIGDQFLHIMTRAWDAQSERKRSSLSPRPLLTELGKKYQQYCDFAQQDAHEFLRILFDAMRMEEVDMIKKRQPPPPKRKPLKRKRSRRSSTVVAPRTDTPTDTLLPFPDMLFGGQLASILVCQKCKRISQTYEDFYDISLSINPEDYANSSSSAFSTAPPLGAAANFFANSFKNVGKGKGKDVKYTNKDTREAKDAKEGKEEKEGEADEAELLRKGRHRHGHERRRDKFRKLARKIVVFNGHAGTTKSGPGTPRSSSVPPSEERINDKDIAAAKAAGGREVLRRTRSRSLDHFHRVPDLGTEGPEAAHDQASNSDGEESVTGRDESVTPPSDWDVVKEGEVAEIRAEKADEVVVLPPDDGKKEKKAKDKEADGWTKLGKRLSMSVGLTRPSRGKDREREDDKEREKKDHQDEDKPNSRRPPHNPKVLMNALLDDIRARRKSRESSPDPSWVAPDVPPVPPLPPLPPALGAKARPVSTPPSPSPQSSPYYTAHTSSPLSQPLHEDKEQPQPPSLLETDSSVTLPSSSAPAPSSLSSSNPKSHRLSQDNAIRPSSPKHPMYKPYHPPSPTPAEAEYLRRILADTDVSGSKSSPTPSGGWPQSSTSSHSLVNPFTLLMKSSGGAKNKVSSVASGRSGSETHVASSSILDGAPGGEVDARQGSRTGLNLNSNSHGGKWSTWLGMHRRSGIEECLRLFTSVEVMDNENMVGCRRCWKIAHEGKQKGDDGEDEDEREDDDEEDDDDDDDDSDSNEDYPSVKPPPPPGLRLDTPGGMPIPTISTTGPEAESLFEPLSPLSSATPTRTSRVLHPLRSNSADFISLSALSLREVSRLETDISDRPVALARNASSPSIPSALTSPETQYPPPLPYPLSNQLSEGTHGLGSSLDIPHAAFSRRTRLASSTDGESDEYESGSAVDSSRSGEGTDFQDLDDGDGLSIGSSSSVSVSPSPESDIAAVRNKNAGLAEIPEVSIESLAGILEAGTRVDATAEAEEVKPVAVETTPTKSKSAKPPKKPKPVVMRPAYKRYLISSAPAVLVIHLKRFQQMNKAPLISFTPTYGFRKLEDYVTFPEYLDLTPFLAPKKEDIISKEKAGKDRKGTTNEKKNERCMYRLYAVVVHIGNMLGGHYVAYTAIPDRLSARPDSAGSSTSSSSFGTQNESKTSFTGTESATSGKLVDSTPPPMQRSKSKGGKQERRWAYISDQVVRLATLEEVLKARAYICMYERI
ncbi:hypothetical protein M378DRAFT_379001 [Amanita muscaria Koide BX008]|uniref:ubiquitinyl hydrolase 1 n=1 Tax=Amanita muscaria (strain Koide BX008) TaxID=946122 RepID=A0A0C2W8T6_AMAMK|nr:hypothetical protein M378DRAFT_379001 [Amanita muscaria Koide BX008]